MSFAMLLCALLPLVVILALLIIWKLPADITGLAGLAAVALVAFVFFNTSPEVLARSTLAGLIKSFPVSMIVAASLLQMALMEKTGALKRIIIFIKTLAVGNKAVQIMLINIGFGTLMVSVGATPVSILPPILLAMGYSTVVAIALPAIGYDSLCTYALLGAPIVVFVDIANMIIPGAGITLSTAGKIFYLFLPLVSTMIGFAMLWITGKWKAIKEGWVPVILTGIVIALVTWVTNQYDNLVVLTGVVAGLSVILVMSGFQKVSGGKLVDQSVLTAEEKEFAKSYPLWKAFVPWFLLIILILSLNVPRDLFNLLYGKLKFPIKGLTANGAPIDTRFLWQAYTWIMVSIVLSLPFLKPSGKQLKDMLATWLKRAPRPVLAAGIFFAIGEIMNMSGFNMTDKKFAVDSMVTVLANFSASAFQSGYGLIVPFIGLLGGFITGSEASTIGMFAKYTIKTAQNLNFQLSAVIALTAGLAFGGGLASVISPAKLQNAAASIDKIGEESKVIRIAFVISLLLTLVTALFLFGYLSFFLPKV